MEEKNYETGRRWVKMELFMSERRSEIVEMEPHEQFFLVNSKVFEGFK